MPIGASRRTGCVSAFTMIPGKKGCGATPLDAAPYHSVLGLVELALDPGTDGTALLDLGKTRVEHELGNAGRRCQFRFEDVRLTGEQHAFDSEVRTDLIRSRLSRDDEAFVVEPTRSCHVGRQANRGEDVEIVGLTRVEGRAVQPDVGELHASCEERLA